MPWASERPFRSAARSATARRRFEYASVMSGNRGPNRSSFGPTSGLVPTRLMWSSMTIRAPWANDVLMPPAAFVSISVFTPSAAHARVANDDARHGVPLVEVRAARQHRHRLPPHRADHQLAGVANRPLAGGHPGTSAYGITAASPTCDAKSPSPEPSTMAISGAAGMRSRTNAAAACTRVYSSLTAGTPQSSPS